MESNKDYEFLNKNVVITGASSGIGQSLAYYFLNKGANVILVGQDQESMKQMCKENHFKNAAIMKADLAHDICIYDLTNSIEERLKNEHLHILINCAGVKLDGDIEKTFPQEFDYTTDVNLRSVFLFIKLLRQKQLFKPGGASIVNISCLYGTRPMYGMISYAMSKAGLEALTRCAAGEFAGSMIRVNAVSACPVLTNSLRLVKVSEDEIESFNRRMEKNIPLGRIAHPEDVVKVVAFLCSKRASKITGQVIKVDGGRALTSSGYVHYRGIRNMNARFEPDGVIFGEWLNSVGRMFSAEKQPFPFDDGMKLQQFVEEHIKKGNFSTRDVDAHTNTVATYNRVNDNDEKLKKKYLIDTNTAKPRNDNAQMMGDGIEYNNNSNNNMRGDDYY